MVGRPRRYSDDSVARATLAVISSKGVHALKLSDVAAIVGATAASLVRRFGTKRLLLLHTSEWCVRELTERVHKFLSLQKPSLRELLETVLVVEHDVASMRHHAEFLLLDLKDSDFEHNARTVFDMQRLAIRHLLHLDCIALHEDVVLAAYHGACLVFMMTGEGKAFEYLHTTLTNLITDTPSE